MDSDPVKKKDVYVHFIIIDVLFLQELCPNWD